MISGGPFQIFGSYDRPWLRVTEGWQESRVHLDTLPAGVRSSKFIGYSIQYPNVTSVAVSKLVAYTVVGPTPAATVSKLVGYAIIQPVQISIPRWVGGFPLPQRPLRMVDNYSWFLGANPSIIPPQPVPAGVIIEDRLFRAPGQAAQGWISNTTINLASPLPPGVLIHADPFFQERSQSLNEFYYAVTFKGFIPPWFQIFVG